MYLHNFIIQYTTELDSDDNIWTSEFTKFVKIVLNGRDEETLSVS